jgi:ankyrin repeat protein
MPVTNHNIIRQPENLAAFYKIPETDSTTSTKTTSTAGGAEAAPTSTGTTAQEEILTYSEEEHGTLDEFQSSSSFEPFKKQYIDDIAAMKVAVTKYLPEGRAYELTEKLETFQEHLFVDRSFFSTNIDDIFGETKTQFHHLATTINAETLTDEKRVACLEQALGEIDLCSEGVAPNVGNADTLLRYVMCGIDGDLATIRTDLLTAEAQAFASEHHSDTEFWEANEIHLVNRYLAALPQELGLSMTVDRFRQPVSDELLQQFTLRAETILTPMKIAWTLADGYFDKLAGILAERNIQPTEDRDLGVLFGQAGDKNDLKEKIEELVTSPLKRVAPTFHAYQLLTEGNNGEYNFKDARSILRHEVSHGLLKALSTRAPEPSVFTHIGERHHHIMQLDGMQYWLENFASEKKPLTTAHLNKLDLSTWPPNVVNDLCGQAIEQTTDPVDLLSFINRHSQYFGVARANISAPEILSVRTIGRKIQQAVEEKLTTDQTFATSLLDKLKKATVDELTQLYPLVAYGTKYKSAFVDRLLEYDPAYHLTDQWCTDPDILQKIPLEGLKAFGDSHTMHEVRALFNLVLERGNTSAVKHFVALNAELLKLEEDGETPLHIASRLGHDGIVKVLLAEPSIEPNKRDALGASPLTLAVASGNSHIVEILLATMGVDPNIKTHAGETPLFVAAQLGYEQVLKALLDHDNTDPNISSQYGETALTIACFNSNYGVVQLILEAKKTDPNERNLGMETPLDIGCRFNNQPLVALLMNHKDIDPNRLSRDDSSPLEVASLNSHFEILSLLVANEKTELNVEFSNGETALTNACLGQELPTLELLLESGRVKINQKSTDGQTPLGIACELRDENSVRLLAARTDIDPNLQSEINETPLFIASTNGDLAIVDYLLENEKIDPNKKSQDKYTPLYAACGAGHAEIASMLLKHADISPNDVTDLGSTALHHACAKGHVEVVRLLVEGSGVDINMREKGGMTAMDFAQRNNDHDIVDILTGYM